eukprot:364262-Chlamydomonas_euryale.AAC.9
MHAQAEELINRGVAFEEAGELLEACRLYERVLSGEPDNWELRLYIQGLSSRINAMAARSKASIRADGVASSARVMGARQEFEARMNGHFGAASLLQPDMEDNRRTVGRLAANNGPGKGRLEQPVVLTPEQYRAELAQQAQEAKARKQAARAADALAEKREVQEQQRRGALEQYDMHVGNDNNKLKAKGEHEKQMCELRERRQANYQQQQADLAQQLAGVFGGHGAHDIKVQQAHKQMYQQERQTEAVQQTARLRSPGRVQTRPFEPMYVFGSTDWISGASRSNQASYDAGSHPSISHAVHSYFADAPQRSEQARMTDAYAVPAPQKSLPRSTAAPFERPGVDYPAAPIEIEEVHSRMNAWVAKHKKRESPPQIQYSPLNHHWKPDVIGFRTDRVQDQLDKAAARGTMQLAKYKK